MTITHESIALRLEALGREQSAAVRSAAAPYEKERESLRELCGGIGHQYRKWISFSVGGTAHAGERTELLICRVCDAYSPSTPDPLLAPTRAAA